MLVRTATLAASLDDPNWVVFDCRHDLTDHARGRVLYRAGHVPGAVFAPVETALSGPKTGANGRHPLPSPEAFVGFLAQHGVTPDSTVVAYDDAGGLYAARLWWMARWVGVTHAALLDGGFPQWMKEGRALSQDEPPLRPMAPWEPPAGSERIWSTRDVDQARMDPGALVLDARAPERFSGDVEPIDPVAGHIPGAVNRFYRQNLNPDGTFRAPAELRREFEALLGGRSPERVVHQCGSGITACANLFAMEYAGLEGSALYPGSWSEWIADRSRPVATGASGATDRD